jgi:integrase
LDCIVRFLAQQKGRYDQREITAGTLRNYYKPIRVFCEANDITINWLKIIRGLPKPRKFAQDRAPTNDEIRKVIEYPDRRIRPIVLMMSSGGFRVGAWDYLKWGHVEPIVQNGKIVAAKVRVYAGEAEEYKTFILQKLTRR